MSTLDDRLLEAHKREDTPALVTLYTQAADGTDDIDRACFYLTHAFIFALELGDAREGTLRARLVRHGREVPA